MPPVQYQFKNLNHLGLVAAMCRELKIAEYIDARITNDSDVRNVTIGQAVVAMIINGLGFTGQTLYLFPEFFEDKPIDRLIGEGIQAEHLNDKVLGREKPEPCISKPEKEALSEPNCEMSVFLFSGDKCINGQ